MYQPSESCGFLAFCPLAALPNQKKKINKTRNTNFKSGKISKHGIMYFKLPQVHL